MTLNPISSGTTGANEASLSAGSLKSNPPQTGKNSGLQADTVTLSHAVPQTQAGAASAGLDLNGDNH